MLVCPLCRLSLGENETTCPRDGREGAEASAVDVPAAIRERFEIVEPYGRGDSGDLFLVDDKKSSRRGVLKLVRLPEQTTPAEKARLKRELVKQATLSHGVLTVPLATGEADGHPWVFRDWHEGVSLAVRLARGGALAVPEALMIAAQAASALDELHRAGLLHRDLKPGHIIVEPQPSGLPRVHVIDAGLPARLETGAVFDVMGTAAYLSPEQAKGKLVSFRSDLYALGCVLFEMLSGSPPFEGDVEALLAAHAKESAPTLKVEMPGAVATLLSRLLSKEPRERPFSAQQVRRALEPFLPEDSSGSREATQAFDKGADSKRRVPSPKTSGTLPPPSKGKASVPPPPPSAATKPKGASVPPPPKKPGARPVKQTSKTLMGMPLSPDAPATPAATSPAAKVPANSTEELSAVDLEQAEEILKAPKLSNEALGGGLGGLDAAVKSPPKGASIPAAPASQPPASPASAASVPTASAPPASASESDDAAPPWDAKPIHPTEPPVSSAAPDGADDEADDGDDGDLDYDDLAETVMFDREGEEGALPPVAGGSTPPPGNPDPYATPVPEVVAAAEAPPKKGKPWGLIVLGLLAGGCLLFTGIAAGAGYWFYGQAEDVVADLDRELQNPDFGQTGQPNFPPPQPPPQPFNPTPTPPPIAVQPTPPPQPVLEEPVAEEPVVEEPVVEEPVQPTPPERPATVRPPTERPRPEGGNRQARFEAARQRALAAYRAGRFPQAAAAYEEATQINSRHAGSFAGLGACRMRMGQHSRAIRAYQRAIQLSPRHAGFYAALGSAYHASGDRGRARQAYQRALALDPSNAGARQGLSRL